MVHNSALLASANWDNKFLNYLDIGIFPDILNRICVFGYSRTGKSTLVHRKTKSERVTFHNAMPIDDLIGGMALVDGRTVWMDGPAVRALRHGRVLQIDEGNNVPPECETMLYALMDDPAAITLPTGERVTAAPGYAVVMTMNPDPTSLPHPIYDRFDIYLKANTLSAGTRQALGPFAKNAESVISHGQPVLKWERPASVNAFLAANKMKVAGVSDEKICEVLGWAGQQKSDFLTVIAAAA
jgi:hypothetical protein